jgi:transcriptional regulator with XRE-family HTH domain
VKDRAAALNNLMQMKGWTQTDLADHMNVSKRTMTDWLEYMNDEWRGTIIHALIEERKNTIDGGIRSEDIDVKEISTDIISTIRRCMAKPEEGMKALQVVEWVSGVTHTSLAKRV